jgi:threonine/homoserine/homoserine lactone efflux protein
VSGGVQAVPYLVVAAIAIAAPGPDFAVMVRNATRGDRKAVYATAAGVTTGFTVHATAAAVGLGALLAASAAAYSVVKLAGALYLIWLGAQALIAARRGGVTPHGDKVTGDRLRPARAYRQGLFVNVLNPKVVLTFLALMPQFLPAHPSLVDRLMLSALTIAVAGCWFAIVATAIHAMRRGLARPRVQRAVSAVTGVVLVALGSKVALEPAR